MKPGMEFGILSKNYVSLYRKDGGQQEIVLNNQERVPPGPLDCIRSSGFPGHICFADIHENAVPIPFSKAPVMNTELGGMELRQKQPSGPSNTRDISPISCQAPQSILTLSRSPGTGAPMPPFIQFAEDRITRNNISLPHQEVLGHSSRRRKHKETRRTWLTRSGFVVAFALIAICIVYQVCTWTDKWQKRRPFLILQKTRCQGVNEAGNDDSCFQETNKVLQNHGTFGKADAVNITICNANPFRGSAIFDLPSGSYLYDALTGVQAGTMQIPQFAKELSKQSLATVLKLAHRLSDMLKGCSINGLPCAPEEFETVLNSNRLCFRLSLNSTARELRLLLDPEEYDYLLPNEALIGFYLAVDNPADQSISPIKSRKYDERSIDILQPQKDTDDHFVGSNFQTFIQIGFSDLPFRTASGAPDKSIKTYRPIIRSVVQAVKPALSSRLLQLKNPPNFRSSSSIAKARLVQQWAYLRLENTSSAVAIENLALRLGNLNKDFDEMIRALDDLLEAQKSNYKTSNSHQDYPESCVSQSPRSSLTEIVNFTNNFYDDLCHLVQNNDHSLLLHSIQCASSSLKLHTTEQPSNTPQPPLSIKKTGSSLQLHVVQMLFLQPHRLNHQISQMLRRQVNLLSLVNQGLQHGLGSTSSVETLVCTRCEQRDDPNGMACRRSQRQIGVDVARHHTLFKVFNQAIAASTQRLDSLMRDLENTRVANAKHIQEFGKIRGHVMGEPAFGMNSLVSLRIRINMEERPLQAEFASLDDLASSISELLGILTSGLAGVLALITLWRVLEIKRVLNERILPEQETAISTAAETEETLNYFKPSSATA